ncbi:MAG: tetratricopeptide repeat protein, partial [Mariniblastus sp.]|nr:tetratricopeptide repeat protein [Mariniblastus sp.]
SVGDWHQLGKIYMAHGFYPEAIVTFARTCQLDPTSAEIAFDFAFCLSRAGQFEESNRQFERAIELETPKVVQANFFIGRNFLRAEDPVSAEQAFRKASVLPIAKFELAKILYRRGELDDAEEWLRKTLKEELDTPQTLGLLSKVHRGKGQRGAAVGDSLEAANYWSRIPIPFATERDELMKTHAELGYGKRLQEAMAKTNEYKHEESRKLLQLLQEVEWNPATQDNLVKCANQGRRLHIAMELMREKIRRFGPSSTLYSRLGETLLELGETEEALAAWTKGANLNSDDYGKNCFRNLARYYIEHEGDLEKSQKFQALGIIGFAKEAMSYGKFEEAVGFAEKAIQLNSESAEAYFIHGQTLVQLGRMEAAIEALNIALRLDPTHGRSLMQLEALGEVRAAEATE